MRQLKPAVIRSLLADKLMALCQRASPSYNYIKAEVRGTSIYCVHSFYSEHTLQIGSLARELERFIDDWHVELMLGEVTRVGVTGTGEYATGSSFKLK